VFSPDGKLFAYESDESGLTQVYVRQFPVPGGKWQISLYGGSQPRWRRDGQELYFVSEGSKIMAVDVRMKGSAFEAGTPRPLFRIDLYNSFLSTGAGYDVTSDGKRFLVNTGVEDRTTSPVTLVVNWDEELKKE
jgi:dipeptidyl aminopeptidase/acylaminoacyl peptidase